MQHDLQVPSGGGEHFIVRFPGYIKNEDRALATFGGPTGLATQRQAHRKNLQLWLRPGDPFCHPLVSDDARPTASLILKITRPAHAEPSSLADVEVIAAARTAYSFTTPADFQYVGRDLRQPDMQWAAAESSPTDNPEGIPPVPLLCSPPSFTVEGAIEYAFKQYRAAEHGIASLGRKPKRASGAFLVDHFAAQVPQAVADPSDLRPALRALWDTLTDVFSHRPVYLEGALTQALGEAARSGAGAGVAGSTAPWGTFPGSKVHHELLVKLCYRFKNGPWKNAWVKRGYDPRQHPESRQYQVLEYTLPADWYRRMMRHRQDQISANGSASGAASHGPPLAKTYAEQCTFSGVPTTSATSLQLCDIIDPAVQATVADASLVGVAPSDASGWFAQPAWEGIKSRVSARFQSLMDAAAAAAQATAAGRQAMAVDNAGGHGSGGGSGVGEKETFGGAGVDILPPHLVSQLKGILGRGSTVGADVGVGVGGSTDTGAAAAAGIGVASVTLLGEEVSGGDDSEFEEDEVEGSEQVGEGDESAGEEESEEGEDGEDEGHR